MTSRGRFGGHGPLADDVAVIRVVGTPDVVRALISRIAQVSDIQSTSREVPRRTEPDRIAVHLEVRADG